MGNQILRVCFRVHLHSCWLRFGCSEFWCQSASAGNLAGVACNGGNGGIFKLKPTTDAFCFCLSAAPLLMTAAVSLSLPPSHMLSAMMGPLNLPWRPRSGLWTRPFLCSLWRKMCRHNEFYSSTEFGGISSITEDNFPSRKLSMTRALGNVQTKSERFGGKLLSVSWKGYVYNVHGGLWGLWLCFDNIDRPDWRSRYIHGHSMENIMMMSSSCNVNC